MCVVEADDRLESRDRDISGPTRQKQLKILQEIVVNIYKHVPPDTSHDQ